jgi:hypothetical protein
MMQDNFFGKAYYIPGHAGELLHMINGEKIKFMSIQEFRKLGLLQEVNRQFFHPLGLALSVRRDNISNQWQLCEIWDSRDDPEGFLFSDLSDEESKNNYKSWLNMFNEKKEVRQNHFGFVIQPVEDKQHGEATG